MIVLIRLGLVITLLLLNTVQGLTPQPAQQPAPVAASIAASATATASATPGARLLFGPLLAPSATLPASALESPEPIATATASPTTTPPPTPYPSLSVASFGVSDSGVRHNIALALTTNGGALQHVVIAPGTTFSFNSALGPNPVGLPWIAVGRRTATPTPAPAGGYAPPAEFRAMRQITPTLDMTAMPFGRATAIPQMAPTEPPPPPEATTTPEAVIVKVIGGGVCDLASRFVVAGRRLLPPKSFKFKQHPGGVAGVSNRDAVSIWATGGGPEDNDLLITNSTPRWLVFEAYMDAQRVTVVAWFQDGP